MARRVLVAPIAEIPTIEAQGWGQEVSARNTHYRSAEPAAPDAQSDAWCYAHYPTKFLALNGGQPPAPPTITVPVVEIQIGAPATNLIISQADWDKIGVDDMVVVTGAPAAFDGFIDPAFRYPIRQLGYVGELPSIDLTLDTSAVVGGPFTGLTGCIATIYVTEGGGILPPPAMEAPARKTTARKTTAKKA